MQLTRRAGVAGVAALCVSAWFCAASAPVRAAGPIAEPITTAPGMSATLISVGSGLNFPTDLALPDNSGRIFVTQLNGQVRLVRNGVLEPTPVLDLSSTTILGEERGMTSLAFHPDFALAGDPNFGKFYVMTSEAGGTATADMGFGSNHQNVLYEYKLGTGANADVADPASQRQVIRFNQPHPIHRVNDLTFGPDRMLYISSGDGGSPSMNAQDLSLHYGKILRIDVNGNNAANGKYGIPADNPFLATTGAAPEVFAYGFRNPYKLSFDRADADDIWVGDVGQSTIEEVDKIVAGSNYGWPYKEGTFAYNPSTGTVSEDMSGVPAGLTEPFAQYDHDEGSSIVGGFVYRGSLLPHLSGKYVFGDFLSPTENFNGRLFYMDTTNGDINELALDPGSMSITSFLLGFAEAPDGELYLVANNGHVMALVPEPSAALSIGAAALFACMRRRRAAH